MSFDWLSIDATPTLDMSMGLPGALILLVYGLVAAALVFRYRQSFAPAAPRDLGVLALLLALTPLLARALIAQGKMDSSWAAVAVPLLGMLTTLIAAARGGLLAGGLIGFANGLTTALWNTHRVSQPLEMALAGAAAGWMIDQRYRGKAGQWLRQPLVAALISGIAVAWPLGLLGAFMTDLGSPLDSLDRMAAQFTPMLVALTVMSAIGGGLAQVAVVRWPALRRANGASLETAPWQRGLNARIGWTLLPVTLLAAVAVASVVAATSHSTATNLVVEQMSRNAATASSGIPFFMQEGRSLLKTLAEDDRLAGDAAGARQAGLEAGLRSVAYFHQLVLVNSQNRISASFPESGPALTASELDKAKFALESGVPGETVGDDAGATILSFVAPVADPETGAAVGALIGRTRLQDNPALAPVLDLLGRGSVGSGEGLVIDGQNRILLYPAHPERQQETFALENAVEVASSRPEGRAFRQTQGNGSRRLVYRLPVSGQSDWSIVLVESNEVALALAAQIALPTLLLALAIIGVTALPVFTLTRGVTRRLGDLAKSADWIAKDQLDRPVLVQGEDEAGRLGAAFEQMRLRLKSRLSEQDRLLQVSRAVSSNLELFRAMPPILSGALDVSRAASVRVALRRGDNPLQTYAAGEIAASMAALDDSLIDLAEREGVIVISQIARANPSLNVAALPASVRSLVALPLRSDTSFYGVLWLTYDHEHNFEQSELTFLATLAGQAAVAIANSRLLAEAEEGRRKLAAALDSASDALIAVDTQGKVLLMNPAAEKHFGVRFEQAQGRPAQEIIAIPELAALLTNPLEPAASLELAGRNGAILLANTSAMVGRDGSITGRVTLLRDITALKELDNIKTVFLRMVSHDLRSPLTYMRGYLSMLPLSGDLNDVQRDSIEKINSGIHHIAEMTERLLYLSRLQFGDEAELEFSLVDVKEMLQEIEAEQSGAIKDKGIQFMIEAADKLPLLYVDGMLMHQALGNLVTNAVKYTPEGGRVTARAAAEPAGAVTVTITDTGMGIRQEDQDRLFEAFYRVPQREGDPLRPRGTGLGLALVKAIIDAHGGSVRVASEFGLGSEFTLTIPVKKPGEFQS